MKNFDRCLFACAILVLVSACDPRATVEKGDASASAPASGEVSSILAVPDNLVDLTHTFGADTLYWPTDTQGFHFEIVADGMTDKGYYYAANRFSGAEHGGTHIDAPIHFNDDGETVDAIPLERLVGPGVMVDVTEQVAGSDAGADYEVTVADLEAWEVEHGRLSEGAIVLLRTGFGERWPDRERYLGTARMGPEAVPDLHFPGLHPDAAAWLVEERAIAAVGIDTASIDHGQSTHFQSHVRLFAAQVPAFENIAYLERLPAKDFLVIALPMKIQGGSGGPLRIIAAW